MERKIRLGIIGIGNMGTGHIKNIEGGKCPEIVFAAAADTNPAKEQWIKDNVSHPVPFFHTAEEMMDSGLVDAVIVATPHYGHPVYAIMAMKKGLPVVIEKPAGVYTKHVKEMIAVADETKVPLAIMMNQRTSSIYRKMREIVQSGEMGAIKRTSWIVTDWYRTQAYYDSGDWRATWSGEGGGVLMNQCPHQLDLWQWICGMPKTVSANMYFGKWHDIEVEDDVTVFVEYENGATGTFITTTGDCPGSNRFEITLEKGKLIAENHKLLQWISEESEPEWNKKASGFEKFPLEFREVDTKNTDESMANIVDKAHSGVLNAFAAHILRGEPLVADGREGINGLSISNACHLSAWTGKKVSLPLDDEEYYNELMKHVAVSRRKEVPMGTGVADLSDTYNS